MSHALHDMLWRCALAEFYTSPSVAAASYDRADVLAQLHRAGLVEWRNGSRLTEAGWKALDRVLTTEQRAQLDKLKAHRAGKETK